MNDPIIFLDIDGTLAGLTVNSGPLAAIWPGCVGALNYIWTRVDGVKLVLSSSWRHTIIEGHMTLLGFSVLLKSHGIILPLLGHTPSDDAHDTRGKQIRAWRRTANHAGPYVVLDDMDDGISELGLNAVFTNGAKGLTMEDAKRAVSILRRF